MKKLQTLIKKQIFVLMLFLGIFIAANASSHEVYAFMEEIQQAANDLMGGIDSMVADVTDAFSSEDVLTIYISGIDTRGEMTDKSLSDVNIIATINKETKKILLLSTPRDYFVPLSISNGVPDKLTHAGSYGIDVCVDTMEMLYDINIDYYLRFNFKGFVDIIDALGGITVHSDYDFDSENTLGYHFHEGENELNGEEALVFVRERYAFSEGDRQRGRNQLYVIKAVLEKLTSMDVMTKLDDLMSSVLNMYETNIPYSTMIQWGLSELSYLDQYDIQTYSVNGTGATEKPYSMNEKAYVMIPDESTIDEAKRMMAEVRGDAAE